jgi:hypothetical protein
MSALDWCGRQHAGVDVMVVQLQVFLNATPLRKPFASYANWRQLPQTGIGLAKGLSERSSCAHAARFQPLVYLSLELRCHLRMNSLRGYP